MPIGERLRAARKTAGLTQRALAAAVGVTQPTVARWERGEAEPNREHVGAVARAAGVTPVWLEFGDSAGGSENAGSGDGAAASGALKAVSMAGLPDVLARLASAGDAPSDTIAFQGLPGAYSHLACREAAPAMRPMPCASFEDAFAAVADGRARLAMIPIENSLGGRVADIHHLLPDSGLYIVAEHFQPVRHYLLAPKGATLDGLKTVRSHVQALAQCRETLRELGLAPVARADTAGAAQEVARLADASVGAIASDMAGEIYGLDILRARIEDKLGNVTRFVVMSRQRVEPDPRAGDSITSLVFQVRSVPAALYKVLGGFATNGVNLSRLESYISVTAPNVAQFYVELDGHPADPAVARALEEAQFFCNRFLILGVYLANAFRSEGG